MTGPAHWRNQFFFRACLSSMPSSNKVNWPLEYSIETSPDSGQLNRPRSSRLAQTQSPEPSQKRILRRLRCRLQKTNKCPLLGSCRS